MQIKTKNPFIDLHAHLQFTDFDQDRDDVLNQMRENNVINNLAEVLAQSKFRKWYVSSTE